MAQQVVECFPDPRLVAAEPDIVCIQTAVKPATWPLPCKCINKNRPEQLTLAVVVNVSGGTPPVTVRVELLVNGNPITSVEQVVATTPGAARFPFQGLGQYLVSGVNIIEIRVTARDALGQTASGSKSLEIAVMQPAPLRVEIGVE